MNTVIKPFVLFCAFTLFLCAMIPIPGTYAESHSIVRSKVPDISEPVSNYLGNIVQGILRWELTFDNLTMYSPAVGVDGTIYVGSNINKIYAIKPSGVIKWVIDVYDRMTEPAGIASDGTIYAPLNKGILLAINPDGTKKWEFATKSGEALRSPKIGTDGTIYVGSTDKNLYAINPDGTKKWEFGTGASYVGPSPSIASNGMVYVGSTDGKVIALNPDGTKKWEFKTGGELYSSPVIGSDGTVYAGSSDKYLYAIKPNGVQKWRFQTDNRVKYSPEIGIDGTIYVGAVHTMYAISPEGTKKWGIVSEEYIDSFPVIGSDGTIYYNSSDINLKAIESSYSKVYAVKPNGVLKWEYLVNIIPDFTADRFPAIGLDGTLYVSQKGKLYALGTTAASSVVLNKKSLSLESGVSESLIATVAPNGATNKNVSWSSSNPAVAAVDNSGKVTGVLAGVATITTTTEDGELFATCLVTVTGNPGSEQASPGDEPSNPAESPFSDISGHWAAVYIVKAVSLGILQGYPDGTFRPDNNITRAEFTVMLMNGLKPTTEEAEMTFNDKGRIGAWATHAIAQAVKLGIITGYTDGTFRPAANITHSEMFSMVVRASSIPLSVSQETGFTDDTDIPQWAKAAVSAAERSGIIIIGGKTGSTENNFAPNALSTRSEAAAAIVRMLEIKK